MKIIKKITKWMKGQEFDLNFFRFFKWNYDGESPGISFILIDFVNYKTKKAVLVCWLCIKEKPQFKFIEISKMGGVN